MKISHLVLLRGASWALVAFSAVQAVRFATNIALTRLLSPELFGIMVIVNSLKTGIELLTDVGIGQSIVRNKDAEKPEFYNTAWTLQVARGAVLWLIALAAAGPLARLYESPILWSVVPVASLALLISGFTAMSQFLLQRRLEIGRYSAFEVIVTVLWACAQVLLAYFIPTIWSLVVGLLVGSLLTTIGSYFIAPVRHAPFVSKDYIGQILTLGKWIFASSGIYFLSMTFDRLYIAGVASMSFLGIYGIARAIADLVGLLALRLGNSLVFPFVAAMSGDTRPQIRDRLSSLRWKFLLVVAVGLASLIATTDVIIQFLFDQRYHAAGWMLRILTVGAWFYTVCSLNEATLLGMGKSVYGAAANASKFLWLLLALPVGFANFGAIGVVVVAAVADFFRYPALLVGQRREHIAFRRQDLALTLVFLALIGVVEWVRRTLGFGSLLIGLPLGGTF